MKKLILLFVTVLSLTLFTGCSGVFMSASSVAAQVQLGMTVPEFLKLAGMSAQVESMTIAETVYRIDEYGVMPSRDGKQQERYVSGAKLFYFDTDGHLYRVDSRILQPGRGYY